MPIIINQYAMCYFLLQVLTLIFLCKPRNFLLLIRIMKIVWNVIDRPLWISLIRKSFNHRLNIYLLSEIITQKMYKFPLSYSVNNLNSLVHSSNLHLVIAGWDVTKKIYLIAFDVLMVCFVTTSFWRTVNCRLNAKHSKFFMMQLQM